MPASGIFLRVVRFFMVVLSMVTGTAIMHAQDYSDYGTFAAGEGKSFSLECDFANVSISNLEVLSATKSLRLFPGDFFVLEGSVYAAFQCTRSTSTSDDDTVWDYIMNKLVKFDFTDPEVPSAAIVDINWGSVERPVRRSSWAAFAGTDSEGTPYIGFGGNAATSSFKESDLVICPLSIQSDGSFNVVKKINSEHVVYTHSISVDGSLNSGNFTVGAVYWTHETVLLKNNIAKPERLVWFDFKGGGLEKSAYADRTKDPEFYNATVQNLGDNYMLIDDGAIFDAPVTTPPAEYAGPTIVRLTKGTSVKFEKISDFNSPAAQNSSNGAQIFEVDNSTFLISTQMANAEADTYTCRIYSLPQGPYSFTDTREAWTLGANFPVYQSWETQTNPTNLNTNRIECVARNANETDIYIYSATSQFSKYTVRTKDNTPTAQPLIEINAGPSRWYNLLGAPCRPTAPGIYIEVRPDGTARKVCLSR